MTITIPNADSNLITIIEALNEKLSVPYTIISDDIPNDETLKAIESCGQGREYKDFQSYLQDINAEVNH